MSVIKKLKDILFDVEEEEIPVITKEKVEQPIERNPIKEIKIPDDEFERVPVIPKKEERISKFNFPLDDFDDELPTRNSNRKFFDEDFEKDSIEPPKKEEPIIKDNYEYKRKEYDLSNKPKKETKPFKPSPVISPVYGILDQNYTKDDVIVKHDVNNPNLTIDEVRKKAYGPKKKVEKDDEFTEPLKTLDEILIENKPEKPLTKNSPIEDFEKSDLEELPSSIYHDEEVKTNEEIKPDEKIEPQDELESDLFNLIDSMYEDRNESEDIND